jgi:hypothetical protein
MKKIEFGAYVLTLEILFLFYKIKKFVVSNKKSSTNMMKLKSHSFFFNSMKIMNGVMLKTQALLVSNNNKKITKK